MTYVVERNIMVPMRDGVKLATDIYFPAQNGQPLAGQHPAVLHRTPYNKDEVEETWSYSRFFAQHGYIAVIQDSRGTYASEGDVNFLVPEAEDGYDALAWIDQQPWTNGKVAPGARRGRGGRKRRRRRWGPKIWRLWCPI